MEINQQTLFKNKLYLKYNKRYQIIYMAFLQQAMAHMSPQLPPVITRRWALKSWMV